MDDLAREALAWVAPDAGIGSGDDKTHDGSRLAIVVDRIGEDDPPVPDEITLCWCCGASSSCRCDGAGKCDECGWCREHCRCFHPA